MAGLTVDGSSDDRDGRGRFARGNSCAKGHGGSRRRAELGRALLDAVGAAEVRELADVLLAVARDAGAEPGARIRAVQVLFDRVLGTPRAAPSDVAVLLPSPHNAANLREGFAQLTEATASGDLDPADALTLGRLLATAGDATIWADVADRVAALDESALGAT